MSNWIDITPRTIAPGRHRYDNDLPDIRRIVEVKLESGCRSHGWVTPISNEYIFTVPDHSAEAVIAWRRTE